MVGEEGIAFCAKENYFCYRNPALLVAGLRAGQLTGLPVRFPLTTNHIKTPTKPGYLYGGRGGNRTLNPEGTRF